jgi:4-amino-4-deoxy-L-arabinose transferase-like glycosyltransferase
MKRSGLALLLAVTLLKGILWSAALPLWRGIDEAVHFSTAQFLAEHGRLPGLEDVFRSDEIVLAGELADVARLPFRPTQRQAFVPGQVGLREAELMELDPALRTSYEREARSSGAHVPPLYHILAAGVYHLFYGQNVMVRAFAVRQLSVLLGVLTVWLVFLTTCEVLPSRPLVQLGVPLLVSFQPMFTYLTAVANTDAPLFLVYTALIYLLVRALRHGLSYGLAAAIGVVSGLGMLVKPLVVTVVPSILFVLILEFWRRTDRWGWVVKTVGLMVLCALLVCGWSLARNMWISGNPFYINPVRKGWFVPGPEMRRYPIGQYLVNYVTSLAEGLFVSYWADFGAMDTPMAPAWYVVLRWGLLAVGVGLGIHFWREGKTQWRTLLLLVVCVVSHLVMLGAYDYYFWTSYGVGSVGQGKYYLYPAAAQFLLLALGAAGLFPRRLGSVGVAAICVGMVVLNFVGLLGYLLPRYYL